MVMRGNLDSAIVSSDNPHQSEDCGSSLHNGL